MPPYQFGNPANDFYVRQAQQHIQPQYQQQTFPFMQQPQQPQVVTRFVTNIEEAKAAMIDALSTYLFIDSGSGRIYLKKLNNNGLSEFYVYGIEESKQAEPKDPLTEINERLEKIQNFLGGLNYDKSVSGNAGNVEPDRGGQSGFAEQVAGTDVANGAAEPASIPKMAGNDKWKKRG